MIGFAIYLTRVGQAGTTGPLAASIHNSESLTSFGDKTLRLGPIADYSCQIFGKNGMYLLLSPCNELSFKNKFQYSK